MSDWSLLEREWMPLPPASPFQFAEYQPYYQDKPRTSPQTHYSLPMPTLTLLQVPPLSPPTMQIQEPQPQLMPLPVPVPYLPSLPRGDNPREIRNKAEKLRRDKLNQSIAELAAMVPPVVAASRKIDKTSVLRLTAHYLRAHQYVFGDSIGKSPVFSTRATRALLNLLNGFLLTTTYKGLVVVASQNIKEYLGYSELDLLGQSIFTITHEEDREMLKEQLMPKTPTLGLNGEVIAPDEQDGKQKVADALASEKRRFIVRFKKLGQRTEPCKYVTCHVEGSLRMSDAACRGNRSYPMVRRARARGDNPCSSGNDVVFVGIVRPTKETFMSEVALEADRLEYRTRHSIDGEIVQCEQRIALVTGYMMHEVSGVNAMNFIHKDEVRWVIVALQDMYNKNHLFGESCYRLMTKNGQFIYLRTRGRLDVDVESGAITTFVCTNTVVDEIEGKHFIRLMKEKFNFLVNNNEEMRAIDDVHKERSDNQVATVEDPRQLEKVILHLVTNLPPTQVVEEPPEIPAERGQSTSREFALVAHERQRIVGAIEKIYTVLKTIPNQSALFNEERPQAVSNLPLNDTYMQAHTNIGMVPYNNSGTSEYDFFTEIPVTFNNNNQCFVDTTEYQSPTYPASGSLVPGPSTIGMKRVINYDDQEGITRKKMGMDSQEINVVEDSIYSGSPSLETLFDEELLNQEIESAIESLDQSIDPTFPDLLISNELQDILGNIESETGE